MARFTALFDASVLYPAPLRDLLLHLACTDLFFARWTDAIHDEWITAVLHDRPDLDRARLNRTRSLMNRAVPDCLVEGYEPLVEAVELPDPDDRHVLAAAIRARADVIVTANLRDFPIETLDPLGIEAQHPDEFVCCLIELAPGASCAAVKLHRASLRTPPKSVEDYLATLSRHALPQTVAALRDFADLI